ncbi:hypothetical protein B0T24DRAFT_391164 [Lasiosphaeria ovina]|uniref:DNA-directed RNA polymerase subunit n=1 Tax=Lasiosphaeria ovina TaxID=92902 RepID=A0AAE0MZN3_9PEZI|nr:hypothetical protein B0T24DRAFT_391164 [Lasiosphaeria ovina]
MSSPDIGDLPLAIIPSSQKPVKKHKREKTGHKKRARQDDDEPVVVEETPPRKPKRPKSDTPNGDSAAQADEFQVAADGDPPKRRKKKHRKASDEEQTEPRSERKSRKNKKKLLQEEADGMDIDMPEDDLSVKPAKKDKKKDKSRKKKRLAEPKKTLDGMDLDVPIASPDLPTDTTFPFFKQSISLYLPFFPIGFDKPLTNIAAQHLDPLLNHYSPLLRGVLLSYSNLNLSDRPAKASLKHPPTDQTPAMLDSIAEYAVGFGWLTFEAQLFVPSRGKWMEGVMQLQSEGHIGVVCWNKFNASIESRRLPKGWQWVDLASTGNGENGGAGWDGEDVQPRQSDDALDGEELQVVQQMHSTGYWMNEHGRKVTGKLRFRIKNFDVGLAGDYGYLSIEGTFLDDEAERALAAKDREIEQKRRSKQNPAGLLRPISRRVPEFSMTKFGKEDQEEDSGYRTVVYKGSRPSTPDD